MWHSLLEIEGRQDGPFSLDALLSVREKMHIDFIITKAKFFDANKENLNPRQLKVINRIFQEGPKGFQGGFSAKNYRAITKSPSATATRDLQDLVSKGIFSKTGQLKSTRYTLDLSHFQGKQGDESKICYEKFFD